MNCIDEINELNKKIQLHQKRIREIKAQCTHDTTVAKYVETFKFEFDPNKICSVCDKRMGPASRDDKLKLLQDWYEDIEVPLTKKLIEQEIDGFSLAGLCAIRKK